MNKITFKKSLMAVAAGAALATVGMSAANANSLLFPYFATQGGASSYLILRTNNALTPVKIGTVVNAGQSGQQVQPNAAVAGSGGNIHYVWNIFQGGLTSAGGAKTCQHIDAYGWMSPNDVAFQEISQPVSGITDSSVPALLPQLGAGVVQGFLVVSNVTAANVPGTTTAGLAAGAAASGSTATTPTLEGQMIVADPTTGSLFAYNGIVGNNTAAGSTAEGDFSNITATNFGLSWYPQSNAGVASFNTSYYALAVGNMSAAITGQTNWTTTTSGLVSSPYNNDEVLPYSGTTPVTMGCAASFPLSGMMNAAQYAVVGKSGGQADLKFTVAGGASGVVLTKIDAVQLGKGVNWTPGGAVLFTQENNLNNTAN